MTRTVDQSLEALFQALDEGFCIAELIEDGAGRAVDYRFLRVNPAFREMTGLEEATGRTARELVPNLEPKWVSRYAAIARGDAPLRFEEASAAMGRWFEVFGMPLGDGRRFAVVFRDVTERKRAAEALTASEERFRLLADHMSQLAWMADRRGWIFWYNRRWHEFTGATLEDMQGWGWMKVHHPDHVQRVVERVQRAWDTGEVWEDLFPLRRADGVYRWFLSRANPIRDEHGRVVRWFGTNTDVTEQRQVEEQLRARTESLRLALRSAEAGDWSYDLDTNRVRPGFELRSLLGLGELEPGEAFAWSRVVHHEDREEFERALREQLARHDGELHLEFRCVHPIHGVRWMESVGSIERDEHGLATSCHGITLDITERKEREARMQIAMAELNHRVKNTLAVVQSIARRTLRSAPSLAAFRMSFEQRLRSIANANTLLTQSEWQGAALREIVDNELSSRVTTEDQVRITGDAVRLSPSAAMSLHMIVHEWATNAVKYGALRWRAGRVNITWTLTDEGRDGPRLAFTWVEECPRSIERTDRKGFGTQLVAQIVQHELRGACQRTLCPTGVSYSLSFPLSPRGDAERAPSDPHLATPTGATLRVLIVEDRAELAYGLRDELLECGFAVIGPAATLHGALALAEREEFDAALLDVDLAGESSVPLALRLIERGKRVVLLTGFASNDLPASLDGVTLLHKPVDTVALLSTLDPGRFGAQSVPGGSRGAEEPEALVADSDIDGGRLAHDVRNTFATLRLSLGALRRSQGADPETVADVDQDLRLLYEQLRPILGPHDGDER